MNIFEDIFHKLTHCTCCISVVDLGRKISHFTYICLNVELLLLFFSENQILFVAKIVNEISIGARLLKKKKQNKTKQTKQKKTGAFQIISDGFSLV